MAVLGSSSASRARSGKRGLGGAVRIDEAAKASAKSGISGVSDELLAKIDWKYKKPASSAAMVKSLSTAATEVDEVADGRPGRTRTR